MNDNVVVIGSGVGGLASAALLAKQGALVTVLEAQPFIGGRCTAMERDGFIFDFGVHMFSLGDQGPHKEAATRLGQALDFVAHDPAARVMGVAEFDFPMDIKPLHRLIRLAFNLKVKWTQYPGAWRLFRTLMAGKPTPEMEAMNARDFVNQFSKDPSIHVFINCLCQLYFALDYLESSAAELCLCFSAMFNKAAFGYPVGGAKAIPDSFAQAFIQAGGKILTNTKALKIRVENGAVRGVETAEGFHPADLVLSNIGAQLTARLAGEEALGAKYAARVKKLKHSNPYITIKYALNKKVIPYPVVFYMPNLPPEEIFSYVRENTVPKDPYIFMPVPSNQDPALAPEGKQLVIAGLPAPKKAGKQLCNAILDRVDEKVKELFPDIENAVIWKSRSIRTDVTNLTGHPAGEAIGLAQSPGQSGPDRPGHETPLKGLYLVGADAGARGIGTEMAVKSALILAEKLAGA